MTPKPDDDKPSLEYMLRRIKVHLSPDLAEAAFRPNEAMDDVIAELREIAPKLRDIYTPSGMDEAELMELADRLARKE